MNEGFHAIGFVSLCDLPFVPVTATIPTQSILVRGVVPSAVLTLLEFDSFNTLSESVERQRFANFGAIYPDDTFYAQRIMGHVEVAQSGFDSIGVGGRLALTVSMIQMFNDDRALDEMSEEGLALGREVIVKTMPAPDFSASDCGGGDLANASIMFTGVVAAMSSSREGMTIGLSDLSERLNVPLQSEFYLGTGGLEGPADLKGAPKPISLGFTFNQTPIYIGLVDFGDGDLPTYQSNWRRIQGHVAVRERGVTMVKVFSAPGIGEWRDWPIYGCYQLGFTADGIITCDVRGDAPAIVLPTDVELSWWQSNPNELISATVAELTWWQSTFEQGINDQAAMGIAFYDASMVQLGVDVFSSLIDTASMVWTQRTLTVTAPTGTETIRLFQKMHRRNGSNNDGYIDDIVLTLNGVSVSITNPDAETGNTTGWTSTLGLLTVRSGAPSPHAGAWYFMGADNGSGDTLAHQDINVATVLAASADNDQATMGMAFFDASNVQLGADVYGTLMAMSPADTWIQRTLAATAPTGTVTIRIFQKMHRETGATNDGQIDDITLTLNGVPTSVTNPSAATGDTTGWSSDTGTLDVVTIVDHGGDGFAFFGGTDVDVLAHQDITIPVVLTPVSGGYAGTTALLIKRMLTALGAQLAETDLETATFLNLEARLPGEIGWRQGAEPISAADAIEQLLSHSAVWLAGGRNGKLRVSVIDVRH